MPSASKNANIDLIDMTGRVVENIYRGSLDQGEQTISWDLKSKYNAGTYLVKLSSENTNQVYSILMK
jgi:flagellar hook assembly protein FlgD